MLENKPPIVHEKKDKTCKKYRLFQKINKEGFKYKKTDMGNIYKGLKHRLQVHDNSLLIQKVIRTFLMNQINIIPKQKLFLFIIQKKEKMGIISDTKRMILKENKNIKSVINIYFYYCCMLLYVIFCFFFKLFFSETTKKWTKSIRKKPKII